MTETIRKPRSGKPLDPALRAKLDRDTAPAMEAMRKLGERAGRYLEDRKKALDAISDEALRKSAAR